MPLFCRTQLPLKLGHGWIIVSHNFIWVYIIYANYDLLMGLDNLCQWRMPQMTTERKAHSIHFGLSCKLSETKIAFDEINFDLDSRSTGTVRTSLLLPIYTVLITYHNIRIFSGTMSRLNYVHMLGYQRFNTLHVAIRFASSGAVSNLH